MSNIQHGISTAAMGESYGALQNSLSGFGVMAESERMRLGELGAQFAQVGVSGADFAGTLQTMTRGFGMSTRAATGMQEEAMALAQTLGKDVGTYVL
jgi:flagellar biosynthesis protein FliR